MNTPIPSNPVRLVASRRDFLRTMGTAAAVAVTPRMEAQTAPKNKALLGLDAYSIRGLKWKAPRILEYAVALKLDAVMLSSATFEGTDDAYFKQLGAQAATAGVRIEPAFSCICEKSRAWRNNQGDPVSYLRECIRRTRLLGAKTFRALMGVAEDREQFGPIEAMMEMTIKNLRSVRSQAMDAGVRIAIENHGEMQSRQVQQLIEATGRDFVGCCFDAGNPVRMLEDPVHAFEILGPYAFATHMRDSVIYEHPRGAAYQWVALGDGMIDFRRIVGRYAEVCPGAVFYLEIITGRPPEVLPFLEPEFWRKLPKAETADFARFLALARKGQPFMGGMFVAGEGKQPPEYEAAFLQQQRIDSERSLEYAKKSLGVGGRWQG
jgi:sugar phosphate isomerase/epimerase